jgi:hypothetical protein
VGVAGVCAPNRFVVPARLRYQHSQRRVALFGLEPDSELRRILDADGGVVPVPREGAVLTAKLAEILGVGTGDELQIEVLEQGRPVRKVRVAGVANELIGLNAYMDAGALHRLMREGDSLSGAFLRVDAAASATLNAELADAGRRRRDDAVARCAASRTRWPEPRRFTTVLVTFAAVIAAAMVYNARIALASAAASWRACGCSASRAARCRCCCSANRRSSRRWRSRSVSRSGIGSARCWRTPINGSSSACRSW